MKNKTETETAKYRGIVTDRMTGDVAKTKYYATYIAAQLAAEKLCKRLYTDDRGSIDVI